MKKLESWIFYIFLFAIPISIRHIFWYEPFNFIEWTAIYVYGTDILLILLLGFWIKRKSLQFTVYSLQKADYFLIAFVVVAGLSIRNALDTQTALFQWIKLIEGVALYFYIKDYALKRFTLSNGFVALVLGGAFQAVIAIAQFMTQGSLGLKYLGESPLAPAFTGIAAFLVDGVKVMRVYGTTPHANVLALYLFIALMAFYGLSYRQKSKWPWYVFHAITLWAFFLTFSRVVVGLWGIVFLIQIFVTKSYLKSERGFKTVVLTVLIAIAFALAYWPYVLNRGVINTSDEAVQLRILYNQESLAGGHNLFGLGMGNFVPWLMTQNLHLNREVYQPVHNIYLLIYSEVGIFGVALFILFLALLLYDFYHRLGFNKLYHFSFGLIIISVLIFGIFDHYLWTIQAGRLLFFLVLGLLAGAE